MIGSLVKKILGSKNTRDLKRILPIVKKINEIEQSFRNLSDEAIIKKTQEFRDRLTKGQTLDDILPEAFAVVKNTARRFTERKRRILVRGHEIVWDMIHFDVQLVGGVVLHQGKIAEMATGEGKTLVATLPTYLNALTGKGVHVVTVNDYLAARDSEWMGEIYRFLGLTVGCIQHDQTPLVRREQYACDITYATSAEMGFDYLRDNGMATSATEQVQRGHHYAIVDEVDSILIDEARTPLIIAGPVTSASDTHVYEKFKPAIERLVREQTRLCNQIAAEANQILKAGDIAGAAAKFYRLKIGAPRNKQYLKAIEEPEVRRAVEDFELSLYQDTRREELYRIKEELYFAIEEKNHECDLTAKGREFLSPQDPDAFVVPDLLTQLHEINTSTELDAKSKEQKRQEAQQLFDEATQRIHTISQMLRAYALYERDVHYIVQDNRVVIVDENTGRAMPGRRWSDGLHQAVEAKEGVKIEKETQTLASITIQNYFRLYSKLAGMTGTAETEANEFHDIYKLDVTVIPPNKKCQRIDDNDAIFKTRREKFNAVLEDIKRSHAKGQPVLVGTISVEASELLSRMLKRENITHSVLNAKFHQQEAEIVARAGQRGAVTIATNMAGRGTDIKLGPGVAELGGLRVIGTERHESRRIDRQLRGRCARQGDPGSSKFYISFEDDLMRNFGDSRKLAALMTRFGMEDGEELSHPWLNKSVETAQKRVEQRNYAIRRHTLQYDDVMNQQRTVIYDFRNEMLHTDDPRKVLFDLLEELVSEKASFVDFDSHENKQESAQAFADWITQTFPISVSTEDVLSHRESSKLAEDVLEKITTAYRLKTEHEQPDAVKNLERYMALSAIDKHWQQHLYAMDGLRQAISLRVYGQKDPLVEYKKEAFLMFEKVMASIRQEIAENLFRSTTSLMAFEQFLASLPVRALHAQFNALAENVRGAAAAQRSTPTEKMENGETVVETDIVDQALQKIAQPVRSTPKYGRNDLVTIRRGSETQTLKYKKAEPLLLQGWSIVDGPDNR
jgi:preprotein translocase subunit SecA